MPGRNRVGEFGYSITGNLNFARNKVLFIDEAPAAEPYQMLTGNPIGSTLFYEAIGIFQDQADLDSYPHMGGAQPGDLKFIRAYIYAELIWRYGPSSRRSMA